MPAPLNTAFIQGQGSVNADNLNTFVQTVSNITTLRAFVGLPGMQIDLQGYISPGDGGEGAYIWNASATGDNGTTIIAPNGAGVGAWVRIVAPISPLSLISVKAFGALGNGSHDDTAAVQTAIGYVISIGGGRLWFPSGIYILSANIPVNLTSANMSITFFGDGVNATELRWVNTQGGMIVNYNYNTCSTHFEEMAITTTQAGGGTAINLFLNTSFSSVYQISEVNSCVFRGADGYNVTAYWTISVYQNLVSGLNINDTQIVGANTSGTGIKLAGTSATFCVETNISGCTITGLNMGIDMESYYQGLAITTSTFLSNNYGVYQPSGAVSNAEVAIATAEFDNVFDIALLSGCVGFTVSASYFIARAGSTCINVTGVYNFSITGNYFESEIFSSGITAIIIGARLSEIFQRSGVITSNVFENFSNVVNFESGSEFVGFFNNTFSDCATLGAAITNAGTNIQIVGNAGYNPLGALGGTVGASPATITAGSTPEVYYFKQSATNTATVMINSTVLGTLSAGTTITVPLGPNESCVVTWATTAPTYVRDRQ